MLMTRLPSSAYSDGYQSYKDGRKPKDNPYNHLSQPVEYSLWRAGRKDAKPKGFPKRVKFEGETYVRVDPLWSMSQLKDGLKERVRISRELKKHGCD